QHRQKVATHFANIIATEEESDANEEALADEWHELWLAEIDEPAGAQWLTEHGYEDAPGSYAAVQSLRESRTVQTMQTQGRKRLNQFMPMLLQALTQVDNPSETLSRVLQLVEAILR